MGWEREAASRQEELWYRRGLAEAPGHRFYPCLNQVRDQPGCDECCEAGCQMLYHKKARATVAGAGDLFPCDADRF
jgi:hypothetical protein